MPHLIILLMITLKGTVGCDYTGYLNRYFQFNPILSFQKSTGEYGWYLVEYITYTFSLDYQAYTIAAGAIGLSFLFMAQRKIRYIGFLVFIYQMILVQLGLSGVRQFVAVCILTYAVSIYLFDDQKSFVKFILLIILAASFHISSLAMFFILPFIHKLKRWHIVFIIILCVAGISSDILSSASEKYDTRYLEGSSVSAGAWIRFSITTMLTYFAIKNAPKRLRYLGMTIIIFGIGIGIVNSVGLHRFNYYFLPVVSLLLVKNIREGNVSRIGVTFSYALSFFYFFFWFGLSSYADCFIPYNFFFE